MFTPEDAFADIMHVLRDRNIILAQDGLDRLNELFSDSIKPFIKYVLDKYGENVWQDAKYAKFPAFVLDIVMLAVTEEIRWVRRDSEARTPVDGGALEAAVMQVVRRAAIRDACEYIVDPILLQINPSKSDPELTRTKACGALFVPRNQLIYVAKRA